MNNNDCNYSVGLLAQCASPLGSGDNKFPPPLGLKQSHAVLLAILIIRYNFFITKAHTMLFTIFKTFNKNTNIFIRLMPSIQRDKNSLHTTSLLGAYWGKLGFAIF